MRSAVFIERDAILNRVQVQGRHQISPLTFAEFQINPEAVDPLRKLHGAGLLLIATSHQPGLSRGHLPRRELDRMHQLLRETFKLDDILICPHEVSDQCPCCKPKPGLLVEAGFKWHLDLEHSFVISNKWQDAEAARVVGCTSLLLQSPWIGPGHHDYVLPDLSKVVEKIIELSQSPRLGTPNSQTVPLVN